MTTAAAMPEMKYLDLYLLTFNCARNPIQVDLFARHLFDALPSSVSSDGGGQQQQGEESPFGAPEFIVLCLQELAPIAYAFLGGSYLTPYFDAFNQAVDNAVSERWDGTTTHYVNIVRENSGMTGLMVFVRSDVTDRISWVQTGQVGVGVQEMGNKGAVGARLGYLAEDEEGRHSRRQETVNLTFVAAHLAPMEHNVERRNEDWRSIVERLVFSRKTADGRTSMEAGEGEREESDENTALLLQDSTTKPQGMFVPTAHLFFAGDLNYRTSDTIPGRDDYVRFPQPTMDASDPLHYSQLLKRDQLTREMRKRKCLHGLSEAPIEFPPTYKYSLAARRRAAAHSMCLDGDANEWQWSRHRWPSWADRILYLDTPTWMRQELGHVKPHVYAALPLFPTSDHRAVALSVSVPSRSIREPEEEAAEDANHATTTTTTTTEKDARLAPPFPLDADWEHKRDLARNKEIVVGCVAYLGLTWKGNGLLLAAAIGGLGVWLVLRSLLP